MRDPPRREHCAYTDDERTEYSWQEVFTCECSFMELLDAMPVGKDEATVSFHCIGDSIHSTRFCRPLGGFVGQAVFYGFEGPCGGSLGSW